MSTNWITLAATDLDDYLAGPYSAALQTAALRAGQANPFTVVANDVVTEIRSYIRSSLKNQVSLTAGSIPPDLKASAMALIVERMQQRLGAAGVKLGVEAITKAADVARAYLKAIAQGDVVITAPTDPLIPDDQERGPSVAVIHSDRRQFGRRHLRGL